MSIIKKILNAAPPEGKPPAVRLLPFVALQKISTVEHYGPNTRMTFQGWNEFGRFITKGSKAIARDSAGQPLFTLSQTYQPKNRS